jgi:hypothetical protein
VRKGQTIGYVEQLGTFVEVKVSLRRLVHSNDNNVLMSQVSPGSAAAVCCRSSACHRAAPGASGSLSQLCCSAAVRSASNAALALNTGPLPQCPIAGELVKVLLDDGQPVEYQQLVAEISPFFGGHIIGDSKYA